MSYDAKIPEDTALKLFDILGEKISDNTDSINQLVSRTSELITVLKEQPKASDIILFIDKNIKEIQDTKLNTYLRVESNFKTINEVKCDTGFIRDKVSYLISRVAYLTITIAVLSTVFVASYLVVKEGLEGRVLSLIKDGKASISNMERINKDIKNLENVNESGRQD